MGIEKREVPEEMLAKVLSFAKTKETFTTKEVFEKFPNNPEFLLRYALNNLRIDNEICMYGEKRGAFYSTNFNLSDAEPEPDNGPISDLKQRVLDQIQKQAGWFARTDLGIEDATVPAVLNIIKELIDENILESQGSLRWTKYRLANPNEPREDEDEVDVTSSSYTDILDLIKKRKVVTIPMIIEELELSRTEIMPILAKLCEDEEIYHEGIKKSSKYIYKTISTNEVESIMEQLNRERKVEERIDELSTFLISDEAAAISIGLNTKEVFEIKFLINGTINKMKEFDNVDDGLKYMFSLTEMKNG